MPCYVGLYQLCLRQGKEIVRKEESKNDGQKGCEGPDHVGHRKDVGLYSEWKWKPLKQKSSETGTIDVVRVG